MGTAASSSRAPLLRIFLSADRLLVWDPRHIYALRCEHRLIGCLVGALPSNKRQAAQLGPPLSLSFEEALVAVEEGIAEVVDCASAPCDGERAAGAQPDTGFCSIPTASSAWATAALPAVGLSELARLAGEGQRERARVFRDLWQRGWFVTRAAKFGADFLAYPGDPLCHHASHTVHVVRPEQPLRPTELVAGARLANDAKKSALLAHCDPGGVRYVRLRPMGTDWNRRGFLSSHGVAAEGVGPMDSGPQHARLAAPAAAAAAAPAAAAAASPRAELGAADPPPAAPAGEDAPAYTYTSEKAS